MKKLIFEWDNRKNTTNLRKHGVSFDDAQTVFFDENAIEFDDPDHSPHEERFLLLGLRARAKITSHFMHHCFRSSLHDLRLRLILALASK